MKETITKIFVAIETTINGRTAFISGQSTTFNNKYLPQFCKDPSKAKEFDSDQDAEAYLSKVHNPHQRVYTTVVIEVAEEKKKKTSLSEYIKQIKSRPTHNRAPYKEALLIMIITIIIAAGCSKKDIQPPPVITDSYQCIVDKYTLDTTILIKRNIWWSDTLTSPFQKQKIDTLPDQWFIICTTYSVPSHLEHLYYTRNGKKINQTKYPIIK